MQAEQAAAQYGIGPALEQDGRQAQERHGIVGEGHGHVRSRLIWIVRGRLGFQNTQPRTWRVESRAWTLDALDRPTSAPISRMVGG